MFVCVYMSICVCVSVCVYLSMSYRASISVDFSENRSLNLNMVVFSRYKYVSTYFFVCLFVVEVGGGWVGRGE